MADFGLTLASLQACHRYLWRLEMSSTDPTSAADLDILSLDSVWVCETQIVEFMSYNKIDIARLVEEVLVAQGYKTQAFPFGNDGSVYILADGGIGPLGFELPRVAALVRSINQMEDPDVGELKTFKTLSGSENGLFASWLYFSDETTEEASRLFNQATFWNVGGIIRAVTANYEKLSDELRSYFPLKRIWVLDRQKLD